MASAITFENFSFQYADSPAPALRDLNLSIEPGDFLGIIGSSGAGKSTLTYAINGVIPHYYRGDFYGAVHVCGMDTVDTRPETLSRHVGSVFQNVDGQMVASVVEDELLFGLENFSVPKAEIMPRLNAALEQVGIPELRGRAIRTLSGGQKQKVAVAAILALQPEIIVLDEPTGELDPDSSRQLYTLLRRLNQEQGATVVIVEQKIMLQCEFCKRLAVLDHGRLALCGSVQDVLAHADEMQQLGIHVPRIVSLWEELSARGFSPGQPPRSVPEAKRMVEALPL